MEHSERSSMYPFSSLPRPGSSRIPPPTPSTKVLLEMPPPNSRLPSYNATNNSAAANHNNHSNHSNHNNHNTNNNPYTRLPHTSSINTNNTNNINNSNMNNDAAMMPPPQAITAPLKQKSSSRSPTSSSSSSSSRDNSVAPTSPSSIPIYNNNNKRDLQWKVTKGNVVAVSGNVGQKRITLVDRGGQPPTTKFSSGTQARNVAHGRSASGQVGRSASTSGLSRSAGSRPNSSLGLVRGVPAPRAGVSAPAPRPTSAQSDRQENGGSDIDPTPHMPRRKGWDLKGRLEDTEIEIQMVKSMMIQGRTETNNVKEELEVHKLKAYQLETMRVTLETKNTQIQFELEASLKKASELERLLDDERRGRRQEQDDAARRLRDETEDSRRKLRDEIESLIKSNREAMENLERRARNEIEDERTARQREVQELKTQAAMEIQKLQMEMGGSSRKIRGLESELEVAISELEREKAITANLKDTLSESSATSLSLESSTRALRARIELLESDGKSQAQVFAELEERLRQALEETTITKEKLRAEETLRRKLHNQVQELKGNIRVFCRVRPTLPGEANGSAEMKFPDTDKEGKEIQIIGAAEKSALGNVVTKEYPFSFDRVFGPPAQNGEVFEEISQLVQSALDGYNVCIFCYGQTGSGKTYTMSSPDGMIPKAVHQIYTTAKELEEKGWTYNMEGQFVEVYNENINDLLGQPDDLDKKKHEIRHDPKECKTTITDINTVVLDNPARVESILSRASKTRSVAATQANERSSRSHSVFILRLRGVNSVTGERSEGTLNLVDLAGSERLAHSGATGERLKETQNINRSLSCLGDVIAALGNGKEGVHIPYRNSKLTYLLQYSLGGNSKCLMFVMISPMQAHLNETLTSLKFATKVNNTSIGTAKRQAKVSV